MTDGEVARERAAALDSTQGWVLVALGVCILTTVWGTVFTFTVYADRLTTTFGLSALQASSVFAVTTASFLVVGGCFGVVTARFPLRRVVAAVGVGLAVAAVALQVVDTYVGLLAAFALLGTAGGTAFIVVVSLVPQWFDAAQGLATSVTMTGIGIGPLVVPFAWLWLFDRTDFRTAFAVVLGIATVVVLASSLVYRRPPAPSQAATSVGVTWLRATVSDPRFLSTALGYALLWSWYYVLSGQLVDVLTAAGVGVRVAATGLSVISGISIATRVGGGYVGDRVGQRPTFTASVVLAGVCVLALPFAPSVGLLAVTLFGLGIALGPLSALWSPIVLTRFGEAHATATIGLVFAGSASSAFLAPLAVDTLHHVTGGYATPFAALSVVTVLGAVCFYWGTDPASGVEA